MNDGCCFGFGSDGGMTGGGITSANNGLSVNGTIAVLGQDVGAGGDPAALSNSREIPLGNFGVNFIDKAINSQFKIDYANNLGVNMFYDSNLLGAFAAFSFADLFTGAALAITNDAAASAIFSNQTDQVMAFTAGANIVIGINGTTRSLTVVGATDGANNPNQAILQNGQLTLVGNSSDTVPAKLNFVDNNDASNASIAWGNDQLIFDAFQMVFTPNAASNVTVNGALVTTTIQTGDPGAGAGVWQLGSVVVTASVLDTTKYVQIKIGTTVLKLATMQ